jgi:hypothetical protein
VPGRGLRDPDAGQPVRCWLITAPPVRFQGVDIVVDVLTIVAQVLLILFFAAIALGALLEHLILPLLERVIESRTQTEAPPAPPSYGLALLIRFDEQSGSFCPSVQLRGYGELTQAWIRLELVDHEGTVRLLRRKRLARTAIGTELPLPAFKPPEGSDPDEVLGWHWDVVIEDAEGERARWREHPRPAERLNVEAELA